MTTVAFRGGFARTLKQSALTERQMQPKILKQTEETKIRLKSSMTFTGSSDKYGSTVRQNMPLEITDMVLRKASKSLRIFIQVFGIHCSKRVATSEKKGSKRYSMVGDDVKNGEETSATTANYIVAVFRNNEVTCRQMKARNETKLYRKAFIYK